jgi:hypothetical protein
VTPIEQLLAQLERWLASIDGERDRHAQVLSASTSTPVARAFSVARLAVLDVERAETLRLIRRYRRDRFKAQLMFIHRPRMLALPLRRKTDRKAG